MRIVQVNVTCTAGSTGKICKAIGERLTEQGGESYSITLMESMLSSYLPPDFVSVDAPAGE